MKKKPYLKRFLSVPMFERAPLTPTTANEKPFFDYAGGGSSARAGGIGGASEPNMPPPVKEEDEEQERARSASLTGGKTE